jgi:hypothetical protein
MSNGKGDTGKKKDCFLAQRHYEMLARGELLSLVCVCGRVTLWGLPHLAKKAGQLVREGSVEFKCGRCRCKKPLLEFSSDPFTDQIAFKKLSGLERIK